ncbi:single-stranded DNA-binding protein [Paraburkholderia sp. BL10I2N1]|uniref:single-stranded DNA-binding protein n=1 Tax=Paraburkholderia sp. BL10I2N1 TaxID=1938796 RepID=UPI00105F6281|nr:single-stranded DNA-binding protein [Paraburkholderia sp. BL10I2N1]TDN69315.1 single-stranded DNA-binding protein [Paraburkholderia sp. BL10I2N1]
MIDGLVGGRLYGEAQIRTGQNGKRFVTCKVRATAGDGETLFVNVIAFDDDVQTALLALSDADSVALTGALTPKVWTDKNGLVKPALDMVAHGLLTAYNVRRKRQALGGDAASQTPHAGDDLDDPL